MRRLGDAAADPPARRAVAVPHGLGRARRVDRARVGAVVRGVPARAHLRAARHEGHRLPACPPRSSRACRRATATDAATRASRSATIRATAAYAQPPSVPVRRRRPRLDGRRLPRVLPDAARQGPAAASVRILSRPSVELMTTDQLSPEQKAGAALLLGDEPRAGASASRWSRGATASRPRRGDSAGTAARHVGLVRSGGGPGRHPA